MTLGPKAEAALKDGPQLVREVPLYDGPRVRIYETPEAFARRVALIAQEEERERWNEIVKVCNTFREMCDKLARGPL